MLGNESAAPDPERNAMSRSLGREIRDCLEKLVPARRAAVTLSLLGCPVREIATRLQIAEKSADNRLYRGMKNLRDCLTGKGLRP